MSLCWSAIFGRPASPNPTSSLRLKANLAKAHRYPLFARTGSLLPLLVLETVSLSDVRQLRHGFSLLQNLAVYTSNKSQKGIMAAAAARVLGEQSAI